MTRTLSTLAAAAAAFVVLAPGAALAQNEGDAVTAALLDRFEVVSGHIVASAERIPEEHFGFRPTEDVRSVAEQLTHILAAQTGYCAAAAGVTPPAEARGPAATKAEIIEKLTASRSFCLDVYRNAGADGLHEAVTVFGGTNSRAGVLIQNIAHKNLHYGNLVTYMRLLGIVPPSTDG